MSKRDDFVNKALSLVGTKEGSKGHKQIVSDYNKACDKGRQMDMSTPWCAGFVGAVAQETDNTLNGTVGVPVDCSCGKMIDKAKAAGIWQENDAYTPNKGDIVMYDWKDSGKGDDTKGHDHTGIVTSVTAKQFKVVEGNKSKAVGNSDGVGTRSMGINGKYIRGFIVPKFADEVAAAPSQPVEQPQPPVEKPAEPAKPETQKMRVKTNSGLPLRLRSEPNTKSANLTQIKNGTVIDVSAVVDGESVSGNKQWAKTSYQGKTGYCSMKYLKKEG